MNERNKKMLVPILITMGLLVYYIFYFILVINVIPDLIEKILLGIIPVSLGIGSIITCKQRIDEIKGGEEDDLSQY